MKNSLKGFLMILLSALLYGLNPLLAKSVYACGGNPMTIAVCRMLFGVLFFGILHKISAPAAPAVRPVRMPKLALSALGYVLTPILLTTSYYYLDSGLATTVHFVYPVLVLIGSILFCGKRLSGRTALCCALSVLGVVCFYTPGGQISLPGIALALASAVAFASYVVSLEATGLLDLPVFQLSCWLCIFGAAAAILAALLSGQQVFCLTGSGWLIMSVYALVASLAAAFFHKGENLIGSQKAALLSVFEPITSVILGILVYNEKLTVKSGFGIVLILSSVCLLSLPDLLKKAASKQ